ncbi:MAG: outer membrane protein assembly factor BamB family protein, partial [Planctomycetota bacterium]
MRPLLQLLPILALSAAAGARAEESVWTSPRGTPDGRAACVWRSPEPPPEIREWHYSSRHRRRYTMGTAVWASPAIALVKGRPVAFIGGYDQRMHALDLADKRPLWVALTNGEIGGPPAVGPVGGEQVVFWGSADLTVYAVYADPAGDEDGRVLWTRQLVRPTSTHGQPSVSAPLLHAGRLYITCFVYDRAFARSEQRGWLYCLEAATGRVLWRQEVSQGPVGHPAGREIDGRFTVFLCARKG